MTEKRLSDRLLPRMPKAELVEKTVLPTVKELVEQEETVWGRHIPEPPSSLLTLWESGHDLGFRFAAHCPGPVQIKEDVDKNKPVTDEEADPEDENAQSPKKFFVVNGKIIRPDQQLWADIEAGYLPIKAGNLRHGWILFEIIQKPHFEIGMESKTHLLTYKDDPLGPSLAQLREDRKIGLYPSGFDLPSTSRLGLLWEEISRHADSKTARMLKVSPQWTRRPTYAELLIMGNLFHPELGRTNTSEWLNDVYKHPSYQSKAHLTGGSSALGGLTGYEPYLRGARHGFIGYRIVVDPNP